MLPTYRVLNFGLAVLAAAGLFVLSTVTLLAQSGQLPSPTSHISDVAGVVDPQTKTRLETLLANLKEKTKIELYVAVIDNTDGRDIAEFSQRLADQWNIGGRNSRTKSLLGSMQPQLGSFVNSGSPGTRFMRVFWNTS